MVARTGGIFGILVFWHFFADWVFQSHKEALTKASDWKVRFRHCWLYAALFMPLVAFLKCDEPTWLRPWAGPGVLVFVILFLSHFIIDTYWPVMMWAKHVRRFPQFAEVTQPFMKGWDEFINQPVVPTPPDPPAGWQDKIVDHPLHRTYKYKTDWDAFEAIFATPTGAIICITMDQFTHIAFLLPIAYMIVTH